MTSPRRYGPSPNAGAPPQPSRSNIGIGEAMNMVLAGQVKDFNRWASSVRHKKVTLDFSRAPNDGTPLVYDLSGINFSQMTIISLNLATGCKTPYNLEGANFKGADISDAFWLEINLKEANFEGAVLEGSNLYGADLYCADCTEADLSNVSLESANLTGISLQNADLVGLRYHGSIGLTEDQISRIEQAQRATLKQPIGPH